MCEGEKGKGLRLHHRDPARRRLRVCGGYGGFRTGGIGFGIAMSFVAGELLNRLGFVRSYIFLDLLSGDCGPRYRRDSPGDIWGTQPVPLLAGG